VSEAGVQVREIREIDELREASTLFHRIWGIREDGGLPITADLLRAFSHTDNYVAGAFDGMALRGALVAFLAGPTGQVHLHSHILGVVPSTQARGVGFALKMHQRSWARERGITTVQWTFDPLVRRNAYFNLTKLGAEIDSYLPNFYGAMGDEQNRDDESDRLLVRWDTAAAGEPPLVDALASAPGAATVLRCGDDGGPIAGALSAAETLLVEVPGDIVELRRTQARRAKDWRMALRETLVRVLGDGYRCAGLTREGRYVFRRGA
jgi:predicted GNAT superfamily acetyltransferase